MILSTHFYPEVGCLDSVYVIPEVPSGGAKVEVARRKSGINYNQLVISNRTQIRICRGNIITSYGLDICLLHRCALVYGICKQWLPCQK